MVTVACEWARLTQQLRLRGAWSAVLDLATPPKLAKRDDRKPPSICDF